MQGTVLYGPRDVRFEDRDDPRIEKPTDPTPMRDHYEDEERYAMGESAESAAPAKDRLLERPLHCVREAERQRPKTHRPMKPRPLTTLFA